MAMRRNRNKDVVRPGEGEIVAILGVGARFEGKLEFEGTVQINGKFSGEIHSADTLLVGEGAEVHADIDVGAAVITGTVVGNIRARHSVEMHSPARLTGNIVSPTLRVDPGVVFEGSVRMSDPTDAASQENGNNGQALPPARSET